MTDAARLRETLLCLMRHGVDPGRLAQADLTRLPRRVAHRLRKVLALLDQVFEIVRSFPDDWGDLSEAVADELVSILAQEPEVETPT